MTLAGATVTRILPVAAAVLAFVGLAVAGYLAFENLQGNTGVCVGVHGCSTVQNSRYGKILGVPISVPGMLLYAALLVAAVLFFRTPARRPDVALAGFLGSVAGLMMSGYLTYLEAFVLDAWCSYCIASALLMVGLFVTWTALLATAMRTTSHD